MKIYQHPPITEAVIELRTGSSVSTKDQEKFMRRLIKDYPHSEPRNNVEVRIDPPTGGVTVSNRQQGFCLRSEDQADIITFHDRAMAVARLAPYLGWEALYDHARTAWNHWKRFIISGTVNRVGVRYINRIDIPLGDQDELRLEEYLKFYPLVPQIGTLPMMAYLAQVTKPTANPLWIATITSTKVPSPLVNTLSLLLDIDLFRTEEIPIRDEKLWDMVNEARDIKNTVFASCITPKTEKLFD